MDQAGAVLGGDVVAEHHVVRAGDVDQVEGAGVGGVLQLRALEGGQHLGALAQRGDQQRLGHHQHLVGSGGTRRHVGHVGVHGHRGVGDQRPGSGGPDQQRGAEVGQRARGGGHADVDRRAGDGLVAARLAELVVGQASAAARAVGGDPEVAEQQVLVEDDLERPPDGLHVGGIHRAVGLGQVDPVAHPLGHVLEGVHVPEHRRAAPVVELGDAVRLDVLLAGQAELFLDGHLDGQAVAVPARLAGHAVALHRLVAGEEVLEDAGLDVVHAGHAVGGGRALVEDPVGAAGVLLDRALEDLAVPPAVEHLVFKRGQVDLRGKRTEIGGHDGWDLHAGAGSGVEGRSRDGPAVPPSLTFSREGPLTLVRCRVYWVARTVLPAAPG